MDILDIKKDLDMIQKIFDIEGEDMKEIEELNEEMENIISYPGLNYEIYMNGELEGIEFGFQSQEILDNYIDSYNKDMDDEEQVEEIEDYLFEQGCYNISENIMEDLCDKNGTKYIQILKDFGGDSDSIYVEVSKKTYEEITSYLNK